MATHNDDMAPSIRARIWRARGGLPTPGPTTLRYGGNTLCVEVRWGSHTVILDGGSGLREYDIATAGTPLDADILLSQTHLDHVCGLPFFRAARVGWGHSTRRAGVTLPDTAGVGTLILFHHEPDHDDAMMDTVAQDVARQRPGSLVAAEGMELIQPGRA